MPGQGDIGGGCCRLDFSTGTPGGPQIPICHHVDGASGMPALLIITYNPPGGPPAVPAGGQLQPPPGAVQLPPGVYFAYLPTRPHEVHFDWMP